MSHDVPWEGNKPSIEDLLVVQEWTEDVLDALIQRRTPESRWLEYKDGRWLDSKDSAGKAQSASENLRRYVASFANAEGGVLIVGISEESAGSGEPGVPTGLAPSTSRRKGGLEQFARTSLTQGVYPALTPTPELHCFDGSEGGEYLVVVARQVRWGLVSVRYEDNDVFPARLGASTIDLDPWAVRSILLGTRQQPEFAIPREGAAPRISLANRPAKWLSTRFDANISLPLVNESLLHAEGVSWGLISPLPVHRSAYTATMTDAALGPVRRDVATIGHSAKRHSLVDASHGPFHLQRVGRNPVPTLPPMGTMRMPISFDFETQGMESFELWLAVYVVAKESLPSWFRIELMVREGKLAEYGILPSEGPVSIGCWVLQGP